MGDNDVLKRAWSGIGTVTAPVLSGRPSATPLRKLIRLKSGSSR